MLPVHLEVRFQFTDHDETETEPPSHTAAATNGGHSRPEPPGPSTFQGRRHTEREGEGEVIFQNISALEEHKQFSPEELRFKSMMEGMGGLRLG